MLGHPWLHLDGILAHLINRMLRGPDYYVLPSKRPVDPQQPQRVMPLKNTRDVFHASVSLFDCEEAYAGSLYKRFYSFQSTRVKTRKAKVDLARGLYKLYAMRLPYIPARTVTFYCCGDINRVLQLLSFLPALGKKTAVGYGQYRSLTVEETAEDYSLVRDGVAMRPIPLEMCRYAERQMMLAYRPPYWDKRLIKPCAPPGAKVELKPAWQK